MMPPSSKAGDVSVRPGRAGPFGWAGAWAKATAAPAASKARVFMFISPDFFSERDYHGRAKRESWSLLRDAISLGREDLATFPLNQKIREFRGVGLVMRRSHDAERLFDRLVQVFIHANDFTVLFQHQGPGGKDRVRIARCPILLCHADTVGVNGLRFDAVPDAEMPERFNRRFSIRGQFGACDGNYANGGRCQVREVFDPGVAGGWNPERENSGGVHRFTARCELAFAIELIEVGGIGRGNNVVRGRIFDLLSQLRRRSETEHGMNTSGGLDLGAGQLKYLAEICRRSHGNLG